MCTYLCISLFKKQARFILGLGWTLVSVERHACRRMDSDFRGVDVHLFMLHT
uniref:Uncharacterized protein n=1 Tax=Anguilla anguilla TaxID=7936 RepID=A0A0E9P512_ANGAN